MNILNEIILYETKGYYVESKISINNGIEWYCVVYDLNNEEKHLLEETTTKKQAYLNAINKVKQLIDKENESIRKP